MKIIEKQRVWNAFKIGELGLNSIPIELSQVWNIGTLFFFTDAAGTGIALKHDGKTVFGYADDYIAKTENGEAAILSGQRFAEVEVIK